ncbi:hypothetical protein I553_3444 [Mycobacterium xenopi 4042]|nr:hypothetical protein I553_3444 [Mycobacterium xenopi 4042]
MVIFRPDGAHGMYSWLHVSLATTCALVAWCALYRAPQRDSKKAENLSTP